MYAADWYQLVPPAENARCVAQHSQEYETHRGNDSKRFAKSARLGQLGNVQRNTKKQKRNMTLRLHFDTLDQRIQFVSDAFRAWLGVGADLQAQGGSGVQKKNMNGVPETNHHSNICFIC